MTSITYQESALVRIQQQHIHNTRRYPIVTNTNGEYY